MTNSRITRFCACCGRPVVLVRITNPITGRLRFYSDDTSRFFVDRVFLCSEACCASIVKGFGNVEAFQEWVSAPACAASVGTHPGEE